MENFKNGISKITKNNFEFYGEKLLSARKNKGYSQEQLAEKINVSRQIISNWENGVNVPDIKNLSELCQCLEIDVGELTKGLKISKDYKEKNFCSITKKKIICVFSILLCIVFLAYLINVLYKFSITSKINYNNNNFSNINNYSYIRKYYEQSRNQIESLQINKVYYKNGVLKMEAEENGVLVGIIYIDYNKNVGYSLNPEKKNGRIIDTSYLNHFPNENGIQTIKSSQISDNNLINFIACLNPFYKVYEENDKYIIENNVESALFKGVQKDFIRKSDYLLENTRVQYDDNTLNEFIYEYSFNNVSENDIKIDIYQYNIEEK